MSVAAEQQEYAALLTPQEQKDIEDAGRQGITITQSGSGSTADSNERLVGLDRARNGDIVARVTYTSHQNSTAANGDCTDWQIFLYLVQKGGKYLIDQPPPSYQPSYTACP